MMIFGLHIATIAALSLTVVFALLAVKMARDPEAPAGIRFVFAGLPLLLGVLAATYLASDIGLFSP